MAEWGDINKKFIAWLETQPDIKKEEIDKGFAAVKFGEKFKLFIEKHDDDEDLNMDSFTKTKNKNNELVDDMMKDYVASLDKNDKVFKAIDTDSDGVISNEERNVFINKVTDSGLDNNKEDFSFKDLLDSVEKIKNDDTAFLNNVVAPAGVAGGLGNGLGNGLGSGDLSSQEQIKRLSEISVNYKPQRVEDYYMNLPEASELMNTEVATISVDNLNTDELKTNRINIAGVISTAKDDFGKYKSAYDTSSTTLNQAEGYLKANNEEYSKLIDNLAKNNKDIANTNNQITELENTIATTTETLNTQYATKDALNASIQATDAAIGQLQGSYVSNDVEGAAAINAGISAQIAALEQAKAQMLAQLDVLAQNILANKEILDNASDNLSVAFANLNTAIQNDSTLSQAEKDNASAIVNNKSTITQAFCDQQSAQAGMVAMDSYIQGLQSKLDEINEALKEKEKGVEVENEDPAEVFVANANNDPEYPKDTTGLQQPNIPADEKLKISAGHRNETIRVPLPDGSILEVVKNPDTNEVSSNYINGENSLSTNDSGIQYKIQGIDGAPNVMFFQRGNKTDIIEENGNRTTIELVPTTTDGGSTIQVRTITTYDKNDQKEGEIRYAARTWGETQDTPRYEDESLTILINGNETTRKTETYSNYSPGAISEITKTENNGETVYEYKDENGEVLKRVTVTVNSKEEEPQEEQPQQE